MKSSKPTYTVREPGCSAWSGPGLTRAQAEHDLQDARQAGLQRAEIVEDEELDITVWAIENGQTGVALGLFEAVDQQQAIARMMEDAGYTPGDMPDPDPDLVVSDVLLALRTAETIEGLADFVGSIIEQAGYPPAEPWGELLVRDNLEPTLRAVLEAAELQQAKLEQGVA